MLKPLESLRRAWNPMTYQRRAVKLLLEQASAGLFMDPGLGKTSIVLAALKILFQKGLIKRVLVVAPIRVMYQTWPDEIEKWGDFSEFTYAVLHKGKKEEYLRLDVQIHFINPEGLVWLLANPARPQYDVLVIDESTKFKDSQTKRFKTLKPFLSSFARRWILTGTPAPNGLMDLFGQIYILDFGRSLGRFITHFRKEFFEQSGYSVYEFKPQYDAHERIVEKISPLILRLSAEDYLEMPELIYKDRTVVLPAQAMKIYKEVETEFIYSFESRSIVASSSAVAGVKCRQLANGAVYAEDKVVVETHTEKLDALEELIEELSGAPALVLYEFNHDRDRILSRLGPVPNIGSGTSPKTLSEIVHGFNAGRLPVVLGHPASMAHGLNLQGACHHVIWFGIPWNLEFYDQAIARVYRQGQQSDRVFVYHIVAKGTLDERVLLVLQQKDRTQQGLLSAIGLHREENFDDPDTTHSDQESRRQV